MRPRLQKVMETARMMIWGHCNFCHMPILWVRSFCKALILAGFYPGDRLFGLGDSWKVPNTPGSPDNVPASFKPLLFGSPCAFKTGTSLRTPGRLKPGYVPDESDRQNWGIANATGPRTPWQAISITACGGNRPCILGKK